MTDDDFRDIVLALDGASEGAHMGHPDFRVNNRIFASLRADAALAMVKLAPEQQAVFLRDHAAMFAPSPGAWGRQGCTDVVLAKATTRPVRAAALLAWQGALEKPRPKTLARSKPGSGSGRRAPRRSPPRR